MATLVRSSYYLDDWDRIHDSYCKYMANNKQQIDTLQHWADKQPHLPTLPRSTLALLYNLANESTEGAKLLIDSYFTERTRHPDMYLHRCADYASVDRQLDLVEVAAVEPWEQALDGCRVTIVRLIDTDASKVDFHKAMKVFTSALDFELARIGMYAKGIIGIIDMAGFHLGYLPRVTIMDLAVTLKYIQMIENKVHGVHVVNCNGLISQVMNIVRPFLSRDLANKLHFHTPNQMEEFYKYVPREYLPKDYGGTQQSMAEFNAQFRKRFRTSEEWLQQLDSGKWHVKENLRLIKDGQEEMKGSFRKLCID